MSSLIWDIGVPTWRPLRPRISKNPKPKNFDQKRDENGLAMGNGPRNLRKVATGFLNHQRSHGIVLTTLVGIDSMQDSRATIPEDSGLDTEMGGGFF